MIITTTQIITNKYSCIYIIYMYHSVASMYGKRGRGKKPICLRLQEKQEHLGWAVASQKGCQRGKKVLVHWCLVSEALIWSFEIYTTVSHIIIQWCSMKLWTSLTSISLSVKSATDLQRPSPLFGSATLTCTSISTIL